MKHLWKLADSINYYQRIKVLGRLYATSMYLKEYVVQYNFDYNCFIDDEGNVVLPVAWKET